MGLGIGKGREMIEGFGKGTLRMSWDHKMREGERRGGWFRKNSNDNGSIVFRGRILNK